jgi:hypothetical protein
MQTYEVLLSMDIEAGDSEQATATSVVGGEPNLRDSPPSFQFPGRILEMKENKTRKSQLQSPNSVRASMSR